MKFVAKIVLLSVIASPFIPLQASDTKKEKCERLSLVAGFTVKARLNGVSQEDAWQVVSELEQEMPEIKKLGITRQDLTNVVFKIYSIDLTGVENTPPELVKKFPAFVATDHNEKCLQGVYD